MNSSILYSLSTGKDFNSSNLKERSEKVNKERNEIYENKTSFKMEKMIDDSVSIVKDKLETSTLPIDSTLLKPLGTSMLIIGLLMICIGIIQSLFVYLTN
jgi:hypothetical protein